MANQDDPRHTAIIERYSRQHENLKVQVEHATNQMRKHVADALREDSNKRNLAKEALEAKKAGGRRGSGNSEGYNRSLEEDDPDVDAYGNVIIAGHPWQRD